MRLNLVQPRLSNWRQSGFISYKPCFFLAIQFVRRSHTSRIPTAMKNDISYVNFVVPPHCPLQELEPFAMILYIRHKEQTYQQRQKPPVFDGFSYHLIPLNIRDDEKPRFLKYRLTPIRMLFLHCSSWGFHCGKCRFGLPCFFAHAQHVP